nr:arsenate reductase [Chromobacterium sp. ASV5]
MITLYGIPNCNTVKKARQYLSDKGLDYRFHDFKKLGVDADTLSRWIDAVTLARLINRQGTTWRALSDADKARAEDRAAAIALLMEKPSLIKRPVLENAGQVSVGFAEADWAERLQA